MSYLQTKRNRKKIKYSKIFLKDFGIVTSDLPTKTLAICNGGACNGIDQDTICGTFEQFGSIEVIIVIPGKSYSFLKYKNESSAIEAFNCIDGGDIWPQIKGPVYLSFISLLNIEAFQQFMNFKNPPGLILIKDFIAESEERFILDAVRFDNDDNSSELKHRKVKHFGYEFKYSTNNVDLNQPIEPIPKELSYLWERLRNYLGERFEFVPDQLTINLYEPGQGIPPHVDTHSAFEDGILSLSLLSSIVMEFRHKNGMCCKVLLPRRSLCLMFGESRYDWTHGITPRKSDVFLDEFGNLKFQKRETRISLTFRKTRKGDCTCKYPNLCDSILRKLKTEEMISNMKNLNLKQEVATGLEESYVHEVYEKIASHFSETRHKPWPNVMKFVESFELGSILVDVGCGNGKYFTKNINRFEIGCDSSSSLMKVCKQQGFECFSCNCLTIPIRDSSVDGCICIAVIHHLTTNERRRKAIREIIRILKSSGRALIYVWAKNQEKESKKSSYLKQCSQGVKTAEPGKVQLVKLQEELVLPVHVNRTNFSYNDLLVPWKLKTKESDCEEGSVYLRFYHVYEDDELKNECLEMEDVDVVDYYYDQGNWCVILQKK